MLSIQKLHRNPRLGGFRISAALKHLCVLFATIRNHVAPRGIVSDGGGIFKVNKVLEIYKALDIQRYQIDKKQAWQNYLET